MTDDMDHLLTEAGERWRTGLRRAGEPDWGRITGRSRRPLWIAAAAAAVVALVVAGVALWPTGHAHPRPAPPTTPFVRSEPGSVVPAPGGLVTDQSGMCASTDIAGSLHLTGSDGTLTLIPRSIGRPCLLPGMLAARHIRLVDRAGRVVAHGLDPRAAYRANPPGFSILMLQSPARMYLRAQAGSYCGTKAAAALVDVGSGTVHLPVTVASGCAGHPGDAGDFWYGPLSGRLGTPIRQSLPPPNWSDLYPTLHFPAGLPRSGRITYHVVLANHGKTTVRLSPCFLVDLSLSGDPLTSALAAQKCIGAGQRVAPGHAIRLALHATIDTRFPFPGNRSYSVQWSMPGVVTVHGSTSVP